MSPCSTACFPFVLRVYFCLVAAGRGRLQAFVNATGFSRLGLFAYFRIREQDRHVAYYQLEEGLGEGSPAGGFGKGAPSCEPRSQTTTPMARALSEGSECAHPPYCFQNIGGNGRRFSGRADARGRRGVLAARKGRRREDRASPRRRRPRQVLIPPLTAWRPGLTVTACRPPHVCLPRGSPAACLLSGRSAPASFSLELVPSTLTLKTQLSREIHRHRTRWSPVSLARTTRDTPCPLHSSRTSGAAGTCSHSTGETWPSSWPGEHRAEMVPLDAKSPRPSHPLKCTPVSHRTRLFQQPAKSFEMVTSRMGGRLAQLQTLARDAASSVWWVLAPVWVHTAP